MRRARPAPIAQFKPINTVALPNAPFEIAGAPLARDAAETMLGAELAFAAHGAVFADVDGDLPAANRFTAAKAA